MGILVRVSGRSHNRREAGGLKRYNDGDELEVTERELNSFRDRLVRVSPPKGPDQSSPVSKTDPDQDPDQDPDEDPELELERLTAEAESLGVKIDKRWGAERLQKEIDAALDDK